MSNIKFKEYQSHNLVPKEYKWDLSFLLNGKTPDQFLSDVLKQQKAFIKIKNTKYNDAQSYLSYLKQFESASKLYFRLKNYVDNSLAINIVDPKMVAFSQKMDFEFYKIEKELGSEKTRFFKHANKLKKWAKLPEFKVYKNHILFELEEQKYQLSDEIEEYLNKASRGEISAYDPFAILTNTELKFQDAKKTSGKSIKVTSSNIIALNKHSDPLVRKTANISLRNAYLTHQGTLSNLLYQHLKSLSSQAQMRKFNSTVDAVIFPDRIDKQIISTLYQQVQKNVQLKFKYLRAFTKFYKIKFGKNPTQYDYGVDLLNVKAVYSVEEAKNLVINSVKPFGTVYHQTVKKALTSNWVDFMPVKNKGRGAYSIGSSYGIDKKLIFMNFNQTFDAVVTLAHEMGHSMHSYFSDLNNSLINSEYSIFIAEIASTFNELMLVDYMLENATDNKIKMMLLEKQIKGFIGTVFKQTEWSNYEWELYEAIDQGEAIGSYEQLAKIYYRNSQKYNLKAKKYKQEEQFKAVYVPHFYYEFYVYKYAIGKLVANVFFQRYKEFGPQILQDYINNFLSIGARYNPLEILKLSGIDLNDAKNYEIGFQIFSDNIAKYIKLGKSFFS